MVAGLTIEQRLESFLAFPALLVLIPPFLEDTGALGGILSGPPGHKLHLGSSSRPRRPNGRRWPTFRLIAFFALPVFAAGRVVRSSSSLFLDLASPGPLRMVEVSPARRVLATTACVAIAYYGSIAAFRLGLDPDNHGIPLLTSSMDLVGALALIFAILIMGVG